MTQHNLFGQIFIGTIQVRFKEMDTQHLVLSGHKNESSDVPRSVVVQLTCMLGCTTMCALGNSLGGFLRVSDDTREHISAFEPE